MQKYSKALKTSYAEFCNFQVSSNRALYYMLNLGIFAQLLGPSRK